MSAATYVTCLARRGILAAAVTLSLSAGACSSARQAEAPRAAQAATATRDAIYEVFVRDFSPEGNLRGVLQGLHRIQATGTNVVWLMPVQPIGEKNRKGPLGSPYSIRDYRAVNPDFGTAADFRALVQAVHRRGMKIIIDWVPNHTAWDHVWVTQHPEFYIRDAAGELSVPRDNEGKLTDWTDVADLDYSSPGLRRAMIDDMRYWLDEFDIDGFRVDVAGMVPDEFWREAIPQLRAAGATLLLAEWGDPRMHELGFDLTYAWDSYHRLKAVWRGEPASTFVARELEELRSMPAGGMRLRFSTNHDETAWDEPPVILFGGAAGARAAFAAMALLPGVPLLYNGQEIESPQKLGLFVQQQIDWNRPGADDARAFYRRVVDLARSHPALTSSPLEPVDVDEGDDVIAYRRGPVLVLVNARNRPAVAQPRAVVTQGARDLLNPRHAHEGSRIVLAPYGIAVLELAASPPR